MPACLNANRAKRSVQRSRAARRCPAGHPLHRLVAALNCGASLRTRKMLHCPARSWRRRHNADIPCATIWQIAVGGDDPRMSPTCRYAASRRSSRNDDGALQSDLKLYGRARGRYFSTTACRDEDDRTRTRVIRLIADDQLYRLALLAELDCRVIPPRRQQGLRTPASTQIPIRLAEFDIPSLPGQDRRLPRADRRVKNRK